MADTKERGDPLDGLIARAFEELEAEEEESPHPPTEELVAYQEARTDEPTRDRVRRHLARCDECARLLLEISAFGEEPGDDQDLAPSAAETEAALADLRRRTAGARAVEPSRDELEPVTPGLAGSEPLTSSPHLGIEPQIAARTARANARPIDSTVGRPPRSPRRPWAERLLIAASMLLAGVLLGQWLPRAIPSDPEPEDMFAPYLFELRPDDADRRRDAARATPVEPPPSFDVLLARLNLADQTPYDAYRVEALDGDGEIVWTLDRLERQPQGNFLAPLPRDVFAPGLYRIRLLGRRGADEVEIETFSFELHAAPRG